MKKILNIAHRGYSSAFPENTMLAFDEAMKAGADGFECDLRLTSDGRVVVFHDDSLKRLCGVEGSIEKSTWQDLQNIRVKKKEKIPLLEEMLSTFLTTRINLEIKASSRDAIVVENVLRVLTKVRPQGEIIFSSFSLDALRSLQVMDGKRNLGRLGILVETKDLSHLEKISNELKPDTWNLPKQVLKSPWGKRWSKENIRPIWTWTLDEPDEWTQVLKSKLPFEAIITNKPAALKSFLKS
ncbi:MAG: hypothetical protein J0L93_05205 [Deltaproteobacteria bacterium]|nr:hypothetical protein [Deltaproteobacteria bacterium]